MGYTGKTTFGLVYSIQMYIVTWNRTINYYLPFTINRHNFCQTCIWNLWSPGVSSSFDQMQRSLQGPLNTWAQHLVCKCKIFLLWFSSLWSKGPSVCVPYRSKNAFLATMCWFWEAQEWHRIVLTWWEIYGCKKL